MKKRKEGKERGRGRERMNLCYRSKGILIGIRDNKGRRWRCDWRHEVDGGPSEVFLVFDGWLSVLYKYTHACTHIDYTYI